MLPRFDFSHVERFSNWFILGPDEGQRRQYLEECTTVLGLNHKFVITNRPEFYIDDRTTIVSRQLPRPDDVTHLSCVVVDHPNLGNISSLVTLILSYMTQAPNGRWYRWRE
jgi:hypothetical protein